MPYIPADRISITDALAEHGAEFIGPLLASGDIPISMLREDGRFMGVVSAARLFKMVDGDEICRTGRMSTGEEVFIERRHIAVALRKAENAGKPKPHLVVDNVQSLPRGRPGKYDWAAAAAWMAWYVVENDYPEFQATLVRAVTDWFGEKAPDSREVERFVANFYKNRPYRGK